FIQRAGATSPRLRLSATGYSRRWRSRRMPSRPKSSGNLTEAPSPWREGDESSGLDRLRRGDRSRPAFAHGAKAEPKQQQGQHPRRDRHEGDQQGLEYAEEIVGGVRGRLADRGLVRRPRRQRARAVAEQDRRGRQRLFLLARRRAERRDLLAERLPLLVEAGPLRPGQIALREPRLQALQLGLQLLETASIGLERRADIGARDRAFGQLAIGCGHGADALPAELGGDRRIDRERQHRLDILGTGGAIVDAGHPAARAVTGAELLMLALHSGDAVGLQAEGVAII